MREPGWRVLLVAVAVAVAACTTEAEPPTERPSPSPSVTTTGPTATGSLGPTGSNVGALPHACELVGVEDAGIALAADVEVVEDPFAEGVLEGDSTEFSSVCSYRPVGEDGRERFVALGLSIPGAITDEAFDRLTEGGIALGGPGDEGYAVDEGVIFRSDDLVIIVQVVTGEGMDLDRSLALEIAGVAAERLPPPAPDPANAACAILTEELVEANLPFDVVFGSDAILDDTRHGCGYRQEGGPAFVSLRTTVGAEAATDFEAAAGRDGFDELEGLGDRAAARSDAGAVDVVVLVGDTFLAVTSFAPDDDLTEPTIALARAVVGDSVTDG